MPEMKKLKNWNRRRKVWSRYVGNLVIEINVDGARPGVDPEISPVIVAKVQFWNLE